MTTFKNTEADQFLHEVQTWGRALDFYKQENAYLKTRLSQVVDHNHDRLFLASAEHFNNRFVFVDEYIAELMQDVRMQSDLIKKSLSGEKSQDKVMLTPVSYTHLDVYKRQCITCFYKFRIINRIHSWHSESVHFFI